MTSKPRRGAGQDRTLERRIFTQRRAEADLVEIWQYSCERWDESQADEYLDKLHQGIRRLADDPQLGIKRDYVRQGYRVLFVGSHAIYYTVGDSAIHVVRVLHRRMDPGRYL